MWRFFCPVVNINSLWEQHRDKLGLFVKSRVRNECDAKDILHQIFLTLTEKHSSVRDPEKIRSWLYQVARNAIIDHYRRENRMTELPENLPAAKNQKNAWEMISRCVRPFIEELPPSYRDALLLSEIEGMSQAEVAKKLRLPLATAKARILRGKQKLRKKFEDCCIFECGPRKAEIHSDDFGKDET